jgi:APA family basic amino acid/polyamine antiporter
MQRWMVGVVAFGSGGRAHRGAARVPARTAAHLLRDGARRECSPEVFARVHPRFKTPHVTTIVTGLAVGVTSSFTSLDAMVDLTNIGTLFAFILVCIGITILRIKDPDRPRSFRVPLGAYVIPILGAVSCAGLIYYLPPSSWMRFFGWLLVGAVIYFFYGFRHSRLAARNS